MQSSTAVWDQLKGIVWLIFGFFLLLAFFLPNYTTPILDIGGLDLLKTAFRDSRAFSRLIQDMPTFFMVVYPFIYSLTGFVAVLMGAFTLFGKESNLDMGLMVFCGMAILTGLLTAFLLLNRTDTPSFFAKMLPKPGIVFYLTLFAEVVMLGVGILGRMLSKPSGT